MFATKNFPFTHDIVKCHSLCISCVLISVNCLLTMLYYITLHILIKLHDNLHLGRNYHLTTVMLHFPVMGTVTQPKAGCEMSL